MKKYLMLLYFALVTACATVPDIGQGFESHILHAHWDDAAIGTRFSCNCAGGRFHFNFEVPDSTLTLMDPFTCEKDVDPEDRVEIFFCQDAGMKKPYHAAEIDAAGRLMDYEATYYRNFDFGFDFETMDLRAQTTPWGYRVAGSVDCDELRRLGLDLEGGFWMGVFQGDARPDGSISWYSLVDAHDESPDFHKPNVLFKVRMTPMKETRGVVVYPGDITSLGLDAWEKRINEGGLDLIALHAATVNDPIDSLEAFVLSPVGQGFLDLCRRKGVDVEYELHAIEYLLPRTLFAEHPEYFREDAEGNRTPEYNMCFGCAEAIEAMRPQVEHLMGWMKPTTHRYYLWQDDKKDRFCRCSACRDLSPSEQILKYENALLDMLREYDPQATLAHLAYHQTMEAPLAVRAREGIFLEYAPIGRDYSQPLPADQLRVLMDNLTAFPCHSQHILEYWLDESMYSHWHRDSLVALPFESSQCHRDLALYRSLGAADMTCFATWLNADYQNQYGPADGIFSAYASAFDRRLDENTVVLLADLHCDPDGYQPERLRRCVDDVLRLDPLPANVICLGDVAFLTGLTEEYEKAASCLKPLEDAGINLVLGMGNHDRRAPFARVFPDKAAETLVPGRLVFKVETPYLDFLLLDSLQESEDTTKWITPGEMLEDQAEWLRTTLEAYEKPVIVCAHHPIYELGISKILTNSPTCCGFIHGHDHVWREDFARYNYSKKRIVRTLCLPSTGHWGDIGYVVLKLDPVKAVATLHESEFYPSKPDDKGYRPAQWDHMAREHDGSVCTFDYEIVY